MQHGKSLPPADQGGGDGGGTRRRDVATASRSEGATGEDDADRIEGVLSWTGVTTTGRRSFGTSVSPPSSRTQLKPTGGAATAGRGGATSVCHVLSSGSQSVLLFGAETCVLSEAISRELE